MLTVSDSGGPNEFVQSGATGDSSTSGEPKCVADRIDYLCNHRDEARQMGQNARELVRPISWKSVAHGLLPEQGQTKHLHSRTARRRAREKLVVTTTFPIAPPRGGGQARIFHLYRHVARSMDVDIVSLCNFGEPGFSGTSRPGCASFAFQKSVSSSQGKRIEPIRRLDSYYGRGDAHPIQRHSGVWCRPLGLVSRCDCHRHFSSLYRGLNQGSCTR